MHKKKRRIKNKGNTKYVNFGAGFNYNNLIYRIMKRVGFRSKREEPPTDASDTLEEAETFRNRQSRGLCDKNYGMYVLRLTSYL